MGLQHTTLMGREEKRREEKNNCAAEESSMNALSLIGSV
jgi:hypothetical protein